MALLAACSSTPERVVELDQARDAVNKVSQDPEVDRFARAELRKAETALAMAEQAFAEGEDLDVIVHDAYLAQGYADITAARIVERSAREEIENAELERTRVLEEVRESQAQVARAEADQATARADQLQQELADLQAEQTERGLVLTLGDVLFDTAEAQLKPGADATIRRLAEFLDVYPERRLLIEGHTDSRGSDTYNQDLSQRRADAVRTALMAAGVGEERVRALGLGEEYPVASNDTDAGRQENRRVEIIISTEGNDGFPATTTGASAQQY
jgi:outer membrane protein OmpA-like peptidoglycan-associated protein